MAEADEHADPPTARAAATSLAMLVLALVAVVGLAKVESPAIEAAVRAAGFPLSFVGVVIALLVLLPETFAAVRAARRNRIQISLNLALGSVMASIGSPSRRLRSHRSGWTGRCCSASGPRRWCCWR